MSMLERVLYSTVIVCLVVAIVSLRSANAELGAPAAELAHAEAGQ